MGGCRCTYRNCTVKSDGQTHMFHYPVFDKVRCHQWLTNAQRLNFLDLRVSQLKNRVVCQHHFKSDNFMNFKMDKLTFDAVPTLDGPFSDFSKALERQCAEEVAKVYPITLDDIENDQLSLKEKRANYSVKYADFLTNSEIDYINASLYNMDAFNQPKNFDLQDSVIDTTKSNPEDTKYEVYSHINRVSLPADVDKKFQSQPMLVVPPFSDRDVKALNSEKITFMVTSDNKVDFVSNSNSGISKPKNVPKRNNRVKIISEKKISDPFPLKGKQLKLEPVSPSLVLHTRNKNAENDINYIGNIEIRQNNEPQTVLSNTTNTDVVFNENNALLKVENVPKNNNSLLKKSNNSSNKSSCQSSPLKIVKNQINISEPTSPSASKLKNKIAPERVAAIEEKRSFNKKLRDMIEFCLEDQEKNVNENVSEKTLEGNQNHCKNFVKKEPKRNKLSRKNKEKSECNQKVHTNVHPLVETTISKEYSGAGLNEFDLMASLEDRLNRMENTLLKRIDQNSKQIVDLKKDLPNSDLKRSMQTQTCEFKNEETYKRHLYKEISKFLSPDTNSLIYEELFINRYAQNAMLEQDALYTQSKRRRRR